jgi:hypothetical protein
MYQCVEIQLRGKIINNFIETDINTYTIMYLLIFCTLTTSISLSILSGHIFSSVQEVFFCKEHVYSFHKNPLRDSVLTEFKTLHAVTSSICKILFNIIYPPSYFCTSSPVQISACSPIFCSSNKVQVRIFHFSKLNIVENT